MDAKTKKALKRIYIGVVLLGIVAAIFLAIKSNMMASLVFVGMLVWFYYYKRQIRKCQKWELAVASVIDYYDDGSTGDNYSLLFGFSVQGKDYSVYSKKSYSTQLYEIGEKVNIRYNPYDPKQAELDDVVSGTGFFMNLIRSILFIFSATMILSAIVSLFTL